MRLEHCQSAIGMDPISARNGNELDGPDHRIHLDGGIFCSGHRDLLFRNKPVLAATNPAVAQARPLSASVAGLYLGRPTPNLRTRRSSFSVSTGWPHGEAKGDITDFPFSGGRGRGELKGTRRL